MQMMSQITLSRVHDTKTTFNIFTLKTNSSEGQHIFTQFSAIFQIYFNSIFI